MHLITMARFIDLKDVPKLRVCYQVAKYDPTVIIVVWIALEHSDDESDAEELDGGGGGDSALVVYDSNKNPSTQQKTFEHDSCWSPILSQILWTIIVRLIFPLTREVADELFSQPCMQHYQSVFWTSTRRHAKQNLTCLSKHSVRDLPS